MIFYHINSTNSVHFSIQCLHSSLVTSRSLCVVLLQFSFHIFVRHRHQFHFQSIRYHPHLYRSCNMAFFRFIHSSLTPFFALILATATVVCNVFFEFFFYWAAFFLAFDGCFSHHTFLSSLQLYTVCSRFSLMIFFCTHAQCESHTLRACVCVRAGELY